ncbi:MAG: TatD family hydrolase [Clostridia bacterium]
MLLIDTHAHYDFKEFDEDRKEVFEKLKTKVEKVVNIGTNFKSCLESIEYSKAYNYFYVAIGIHPQEYKICIA